MKTGQKAYLVFKRLFDIVFSFLSILVLSPLLLVLSIIVTIDTKGFPVFRQKRIGKNSKTFLILKFRTMKKDAPKEMPTYLLENPNKYITKCGKWMRKTSLDELPQLFNIFIGQMSFIGPRPVLWNQSILINLREQNGANTIRPGLSGYAQCYGRDRISDEEKAKLDKYYLDNFGFGLDVILFFKTIKNVCLKKDVVEGKQG